MTADAPMGIDNIIALKDWPQPNGGAPEPQVYADDENFILLYYTDKEKYAVVEFPMCLQFTFGHPNDEVLPGHPLFKNGLNYYTVHRIENSSKLAALEKCNAVHPRHNSKQFLKDMHHYIFTFQDSTLECLVQEGASWKSIVTVYDEEEAAIQAFKSKIPT